MKRVVIGLVMLAGLAVSLAVGFFFGIGYYLSPQDDLTNVDAIVAISGGDTSARTAEAVALYKAGWSRHLIFSGAALDTSGPSNAAAMAATAEAAGVPAAAIELDEGATNTRGNAAGVADIAGRDQYKSIILVTSPYHQRRAFLVFRRAFDPSIAIINHSSVDRGWRRSHWWATAESRATTMSELQKVMFELASGK